MITNNDIAIESLEARFITASDSYLQQLKQGCSDCCLADVITARLKLWARNFEINAKIVTAGKITDATSIPVNQSAPSIKSISLLDLEPDKATYKNPLYAGAYIRVLYNNGGRVLDKNEGFQILPEGGFKFDLNKFVLQQGEELIIFK